MSSLSFSLGGKLDPSLKASLNEAVRESEAASLRIQNSLRSRMSSLDKSMKGMDPAGPDFAKSMAQRASLENNLLATRNAQFVASARQRMSVLDAEKASERERFAASASQAKQVDNVRANLDAENAAMLRNRDALKALIAERRAAAAELVRYSSSQSQTSGFVNPRAGNAADDARLLRNRDALKGLIAERNAASQLVRFNQATSVSALDLAKNVDKSAGSMAKMAQGAGGMNLIMRETLVVFREIGRGNWARVPGSLSLIAQGFSTLKGVSLALLGAWALAIGGIVGSVFIYFHRIKALAADLTTTIAGVFKPEHIAGYLSNLQKIDQLHKDVADSARSIQEAHDGVSDSLQRELDLTRSKIGFERELLEMQKANALAAVKNPEEREAIEKKYSALITANKKKERDAEVKAMQDEVKALPGEITKTEDEIKKLTDGGFVSSARDAQILRKRQADADAAEDYMKQLAPGEKDERAHSADADRKRLARFTRNQNKFNELWKTNPTQALFFQPTEEETAKANAAKERMANADSARKSLNEWVNATDNRDRQRLRVAELEKRVKEDSERLAKLGPRGGGLIEQTVKANLQKDQQDLALEKERLKRVDAGRPLSGREVTERSRIGFGAPEIALLDVNRSMDRKLGVIVQHIQRHPSGQPPASFGDPFIW
jgi:hypothetical protein